MRSIVMGLALAVGITSSGMAPAAAGAEGADAIIDRCWAASDDDLSSDRALRIGQGVSAVIDCLEHEIVRMVEANLECVPGCGTGLNNVGAFELAERLEDVLRDLAARPNAPVAGTGLTAQEFIAAWRAEANEQTTVFVHLNGAEQTNNSITLPCNPMWAEGCEIPMEPLARMLRDAGAPLPAGGLPCDRATMHTLEICLPGFKVSPSPSGEQLYLTTRRTWAPQKPPSTDGRGRSSVLPIGAQGGRLH